MHLKEVPFWGLSQGALHSHAIGHQLANELEEGAKYAQVSYGICFEQDRKDSIWRCLTKDCRARRWEAFTSGSPG